MNIKSKISKLVSGLLCFSMIFSNVLPAYAADAVITENTLDGEDLSVNERNLEDITVTYKQASSFFVTIPKTIVLDGWKQSTYSVKVSGDIDADQCVYVAPVDGIADTENIDFYMKDQASENAKDDVVANVTHNKFHWNSAEVTEGYRQADNLVEAPDLTAGAWRGIFQMEIKLETHVTHKHNYVETITKEPTCTEAGEKTYTCDCGDSYTEEIPATGHNFVDGTCTDCGEKGPDYHKHSYTETITKEPTCTEKGEKTYTCGCGDSYTEEIPATGHHYGDDDKCTGCGELNPDHKHTYTETITKEPTCTEKGEKTYTCGCGDSYTEEIPAMGHHFVDGECTDCGEKDPDYHEHSYDDGVVTKEPTCTEKGEKTFTCSGCGHTYTEEIPATGHNYENNICTNCGETDPSHVHSYTPYVFTVEPTLVSSVKNRNETAVRAWALNSSNDEYNRYYTSIIHPGSRQANSCITTAKFEINLPDDYEGEFDYKYGYVCQPNSSAALSSKQYVIELTVNGSRMYQNYKGSIFGTVSNDTTIPLKAGKNTFTVQYSGYNTYGSYSTSETSTATLTMYKCSLYDGTQYHICNECGKMEEHSFESTVTKEATCVEEGEMTYTCTECGYSYTEPIATNGGHHYDENDVCVDCGHTHNYEPYKFIVEPKLVSSTKGTYPTNVGEYDLWHQSAKKEDYASFGVNSRCPSGAAKAQFYATVEVDLPDDYEGEYNYQYYFDYTLGSRSEGAAMCLYLNKQLIQRYSYGQVVSAIGSANTISTIPVHAGKNTINLQGDFYNASGKSEGSYKYLNHYNVYLENFSLFDGSEYHICNECGKKDEHHYVNGVCVQCGWKEGEHEHHYVNGACDQCGKDATQYNLIIDDSRFLNDVDVTSSTQKIRNGDVIELPEKSDDAYNFEGYAIVRAVKNVQLCSQNVYGGHYAVHTETGGPGRFVLYRSPTYEYDFGIKTQWVDTQNGPYYNSELSDYFWKQTAESDIITIEKPMIYAFTANEDITCSNIYSADCCSSGSMQIEDITRNKTYNLIYGSTFDPDGNVRVLRTSSYTNSSTSSATRADKYSRKYLIYLQPGQYRFVASGQSGTASGAGANSHYWLTIGSPLSASETLAAPVINGVHHTEFGGTLYELIPIEDGQEFDISSMYSVEGNGNVYLISNWTKKETE